MTAFKAALIVLMALCIIGEMAILWMTEKLNADVSTMRRKYLDLMKTIHRDSNRYLEEWGTCIRKWEDTLKLTNKAIELLKQQEEGEPHDKA